MRVLPIVCLLCLGAMWASAAPPLSLLPSPLSWSSLAALTSQLEPQAAWQRHSQQTPCARMDEDCREQNMHPDMPPTQRRLLPGEETADYWLTQGIAYAHEKSISAERPQRGVAKNVIFFIGDGMSLATLAATRVYLGGEQEQLSFERFPDTGLARTYAIDRLVPDSANTATAFLGGAKAMYGTVGVNGNVANSDCVAIKRAEDHVVTLAKLAAAEGKSVGLVTTARITDATPSALYAHASSRTWETDVEVKLKCGLNSGVVDIAQQLIHGEVGRQLDVIFGGGKSYFRDGLRDGTGRRADGRNLIDEFLALDPGNIFLETRSQLESLAVPVRGRVLGLFNDVDMNYHTEMTAEEPTLIEMTQKAIELLSVNPKGYFLLVEGAHIDKAHHLTFAKLAIDETARLHDTVEWTRSGTNIDDTLIVVSSDHSHTMSISGYAPRSNNIFGTANIGDDGLPYQTLSYANGPSYDTFFDTEAHERFDPTLAMEDSDRSTFPATVPLSIESHGGEDVAVFASGPWSDLFSGVYDQSTIPYLISYASCLGTGPTACRD